MSTVTTEESIHTLNISKEIVVASPPEVVFEAMLDQLGPAGEMPDGTPFPMVIEPWPGGRWFRDLGNDAGHLWGHVQVIKRPKLLELCGPMFMSYPAINFVQYRLTPEGDGTRLKMTHGAIGQIPEEHRQDVGEGWEYGLKRIRDLAERRKPELAKR